MSELVLEGNYNLIYANWGFNYLNDDEVYSFLYKLRGNLCTWKGSPGMIITKETIGDK